MLSLWRKNRRKEDSGNPIISDKIHSLDSFIQSSESRISELKYQLDTMGGSENQQAKAELEKSITAFEKTLSEMKQQAAALPQMAERLAAALENPGDISEQEKHGGGDAKDTMAAKLSDAKARADSRNNRLQGQKTNETAVRESQNRNGGNR